MSARVEIGEATKIRTKGRDARNRGALHPKAEASGNIANDSPTTRSREHNKGSEIRAKIAANRAKRLAIADAMKREAGVVGHNVHKEDFGGLAYIGTGRIYSPEGRKIVQLYTLAHECGHIFLHNSGPGYWLPGHVKEFEAECYTHQAFREHGMALPRKLSKWGRNYVGSWIAKDRAANISIDPRAQAYAKGRWSPYQPLRMVPSTWKIFRAEVAPAAATIAARSSWADLVLKRVQATGDVGRRLLQRLRRAVPERGRLADEAFAVLRLAGRCTLHGTTACLLGLLIFQAFYPLPDIFPKRPGDVAWAEFLTAVAGGLLIANLAVLGRTTTR